MRPTTPLLTALAALAIPGHEVSTDYGQERTLRVESESTIYLETTSFEMLVDGEPTDRPFGGGGVREERRVVLVDQHLASAEGRPIQVRRTFEAIDAETSATFGEEQRDDSAQGPLAGLVLELSRDEEGEVTVEVLEGDEPDDAALLEGHALELCLDALLPDSSVEPEEAWDLDGEAIRAALALALSPKFFPAPEVEAREAGAGRGEGGRRGGRGGRGGSATRFLQDAAWEGSATLIATDEDHDGDSVSVIRLELEASGELPERGGFGGGGRRERGYGLGTPFVSTVDSSFEVRLEGQLLFSNSAHHPVSLELEGAISTERSNEFDRQGRTMSMSTAQEGTFETKITLAQD